MLLLVVFFVFFNSVFFLIDGKKEFFSFENLFCIFSSLLYYILFSFSYANGIRFFDGTTTVCFFVLVAFMNLFVKMGAACSFSKKTSSNGTSYYCKKNDVLLFRISWFFLIVSFLSVYLFTKSYGGFSNYIDQEALALRAGVSTIENSWSFLQPFCRFSTISFLIFLSLLLGKEKLANPLFVLCGFLLSGFCCYLSFMGDKARLALVCFVVLVLFSFFDIKITSRWRRNVVKLLVVVVAFVVVQFVSSFLGRGHGDTYIETITRGTSFVYLNFNYWFNNLAIDNMRFFIDYIIFPIYLLPSKIWSVCLNLHSASSWNTYYLLGAFKGTGHITGEIPLDFLSCAYAQLGTLGIAVVSFFWGRFLSFLDRFVNSVNDLSYRSILFNYIAIEVVFRSVLNGDPKSIVIRLFPALVFVFLYGVFHRR